VISSAMFAASSLAIVFRHPIYLPLPESEQSFTSSYRTESFGLEPFSGAQVEHNKASENCLIAANRIGRCGLDLVILGCRYCAVPQNPYHRVIYP
jgi:hypothetical protein